MAAMADRSRFQKGFLIAFVLALLMVWSPSKALGYLAPWAALGVLFIISKNGKLLEKMMLIIGSGFLSFVFYFLLLGQGFVWHSAMLGFLTYSAFWVAWLIPSKALAAPNLFRKIQGIAIWVLLIQALWGLGQAIYGFTRTGTFDLATGDIVAGTIRPFGFRSDFSNPIFAVNVAFLLLFLFSRCWYENKGWWIWGLGLLVLIFASVLHVLLFLGIAILLSFLIYYPSLIKRGRGMVLIGGFVFAATVAYGFLPRNFATLRAFILHTIQAQTPRAQILRDVFTVMPREYPWMPFVGLGWGQFTSRAALIGTGLFFGSPADPRSIPFLPTGMSKPFQEYLFDLWLSISLDISNPNFTSSTYKPYFSWLSVYSEGGGFAFLIATAILFSFILRLKRLSRRVAQKRVAVVSLGAMGILLFLLGVQENYWEVPQAIFLGILLIKVLYGYLIYHDQFRDAVA